MAPPTRAERALALANQHAEAATYMTAEERFGEAHAQWLKAAALHEEASDPDGERLAWMRAGLCSQKLGELDRAADELSRSIQLARVPGGQRPLAIALSHLATLLAQRGHITDAAERWHEALTLAAAESDPPLIAAIATNLGRLALGRGDLDEAEAAFSRAREAADRGQDDAGRAAADNALGEIARERGDHHAARALFDSAFDRAHAAGDTALMALTLNNLGNALRSLGDLERAETRFQAALAFANVLGDGPSIARTHTNLGNIAMARGELDAAQRHYTQALTLDKRYKQHAAMLGGLVNLASLRATRGDLAGAKKLYAEALDKLSPISAARIVADIETLLGQLEARMGHLDRAESLFLQARSRAEESGHGAALARLTMNLAALDHARGDLGRALDGYRRAVSLIEQHGSPSDRVMAHLVVADAALARNLPDLARAAVEQARLRLDALRPATGDGETPTENDEAPLRETLDVGAMKARVDFARAPGPETLAAMEAMTEALMDAGRTGDAVAHWLVLCDEERELDARPDRLERLRENLAWAKKADLEPLALELQSLELLASRAAPEALDPLVSRLEALQLGLAALRVGRRKVSLLLYADRPAEARALAASLRQAALARGADAEALRLEALLEGRDGG